VLSASFSAPSIDYTCTSPYNGSYYNGTSSDGTDYQCYNQDSEESCSEWQYDTSVFKRTITSQVICKVTHNIADNRS